VIDAISCALHPDSARRRAAALRSPCAEQCGSPARSHAFLNQSENPADVNGFPNSVSRNVRERTLVSVASNDATDTDSNDAVGHRGYAHGTKGAPAARSKFLDLVKNQRDRSLRAPIRILLIPLTRLHEANRRDHDKFAAARLLIAGRKRALA
jgi:hypothetical protein